VSARRPTRAALGIIVVIVALVVAVAAYVVRTTDRPVAVQVGNSAGGAFDKQGALDGHITRASFSPDGTRLAVVSDEGVGLADGGHTRTITPPGSLAVDAAWMPNSEGILVVEGPAVTDRVTVIGLDGRVAGSATLDRPFSVGDGNGLSVDRRGGRAITVAETRDAIGGRRHTDLVLVDLTNGHVTTITDTQDAEEAWPVFRDDTHILFARVASGRSSIVVERDLGSGAERELSPAAEATRPVGVLRSGTMVLAGGKPGQPVSIWARATNGAPVRMGRIGAGEVVWTVDPAGTRAVATSAATVGGGTRTGFLRAVTLIPPPGL
jgi:dipeptidyl aminopeptidase/acylaminoacyl peptidase